MIRFERRVSRRRDARLDRFFLQPYRARMIGAWGARGLVMFGVAASALACASTQSRVSDAHYLPCADALEQYPGLSRKLDYASLTERPRYEAFIASCMVDAHRPREALQLLDHVHNAVLRPQVLQVTARASATLGNEKDAHAALDELATYGPETSTDFWADNAFQPYRAQDWFILDAIETWSPSAELSLDRYVERLLRHADQDLLPLRVAARDPQQGAGPWAVWTGKIRDAHIDRATNKTILLAEGIDVDHKLIRVDRNLVELDWRESSWGFVRSGSFGGGKTRSLDASGHASFAPKYDTTETYQESFTPNGLEFVVEFPEASAELVQAITIQAVGHFVGHDEAGKAHLAALVVAHRTEARSRVNLGTEP